MRDSRNQIAEVDDFVATPLPEDQRAKVRSLICAHAIGATRAERVADAHNLLGALGLLPSQEDELSEQLAAAGRGDRVWY